MNNERCVGWGCETPGDLPRCQLCPHSPTYWRRSRNPSADETASPEEIAYLKRREDI